MVQQKLLKVLFDLLLNCKNPLCAQAISSVFKGVSGKLQNTETFRPVAVALCCYIQ